MAFEVHTPLGLGTVTETDQVRGRTSYKVAGRGFDKWFDETEISKLAGDHSTDRMNDDARSHAIPSLIQDQRGFGGPAPYMDREDGPVTGDPRHALDDGHLGHEEEIWGPHETLHIRSDRRQAWAPVDHDNSVALPYDPTPQYPAIPGDVESTLQPIHGIDADERLSPADSITFDHRGDDESDLEVSDNFLTAGWQHSPEMGEGQSFGAYPGPDTGGEPGQSELHEHWMGQHGGPDGDSWEHESPHYSGEHPSQDYLDSLGGQHDDYDPREEGMYGVADDAPTDRDAGGGFWHPSDSYGDLSRPYPQGTDVPGHMANVHEGFAFLIPLAEGLASAAGGAGASGAASAAAGGLARGVGMGAAQEALGGGGDDPAAGGGQEQGPIDQALDATAPGEGWGPLISHGSAIDQYLASQEQRATNTGAGLSDKYIDLTASADFHNDPVAQFRHDPIAYINRTAHVEYEPISPEMEHYGQLVEANANIREAAWADVRSKAMRLRREGRIAVKDVAPDRIYASVEGDHGTYDVMIAKEGAFGGFGGGHAISNWRCGCEWGRWAFQRQHTYIGRLCSHGYAAYMEMQSAHTKGQPRQKRLTPVRKRADALQNEPQRLVPDLVINDTDDAHVFQHGIDVTKDERDDTGPDDIVSEQDIVHFARVLGYCDRHQLPYPRELTAFLVRHADDENPSDWRVEDASKAESALNEIRDWSDSPTSEDLGHLEERNDQVRDAVDEAREKGTDASLFTAGVNFRTADALEDLMGVPRPKGTPLAPGTNPLDPSTFPGVQGGPNSTPKSQSTPDPTGLMAQPYRQAPGSGAAAPATKPGGGGADRNPAIPGNQNYAPDGSTGAEPSTKGAPGSYSSQDVQNAAGGDTDKAVEKSMNASPTAGQPGGSPAGGKGSEIGQGSYKIQQGDTLADIAQRSGYGDNYQALGDQNGISNYDMINAGGSLNIGKPGGGEPAAGGAPGSYGYQDIQNAANGPVDKAVGGDSGALNQNSGAPGADNAPGGAPATPPAAATPPAVDTSAIPGAASSGAGAATDVASTPTPATPGTGGDAAAASNPATDTAAATPKTDTSSANGGAGDAMSQISSAANAVGDVVNSVSGIFGSVFSDQADYNEWHRFAYPDSPKTYDHKPFNGSGGEPSIEFGTSEEYADKARKGMDDVWDLEHHNVSETDERFREGGVKRLGGGPRRQVVPEVVREQRPAGRNVPVNVQASMESFGSFDPLASRDPADFGDDAESAAVHTASQGGDFVADFQRQFGASIMGGSQGGGGGHFDDFASSPAVKQALLRTAGRNYSLAEQHDLIREGDIGGAGNLSSLDLRGTHYEDDGVGLFT